jgi:hypothetical protein
MTSLLGGPHHLSDEAIRALDAAIAVLNAAGADAYVIIPNVHSRALARTEGRWRSEI